MSFVGNQKITAIQRAAGSRGSDGRYTTGTATTTENVDATLYPAPGSVLETLPEGQRQDEHIMVITEFEFRTADEKTGYPGDLLQTEGRTFEVIRVKRYRRVIPHLEVLARAVT